MAAFQLPKQFHPDFATPGRKPVGPVVIDQSVMPAGLVEYFLLSSTLKGRGIKGRTIEGVSGDTFIYPTISQFGPALNITDTGSSSRIKLGVVSTANAANTVLIAFYSRITIASDTRFFINNSASSTIVRNVSGNAEFLLNSLTNDRVSHSWTPSTDVPLVIGGSYGGSGTKLKVYSKDPTNGLQITENGLASTGTYAVATDEINSANDMDGGILWAMFFNRQLTDAEIELCVNHQNELTKPAVPISYFTSGVAAPPVTSGGYPIINLYYRTLLSGV